MGIVHLPIGGERYKSVMCPNDDCNAMVPELSWGIPGECPWCDTPLVETTTQILILDCGNGFSKKTKVTTKTPLIPN